ncbi:MAG: endonuclease MutS2 [Ignavibacteriae bacterium]|nr:endonuclease MutS2 [Ignavibacteriota bacterium]
MTNEEILLHDTLIELEFPLVLEQVAKFSYSDLGREIILQTVPVEDVHWLRSEHERIEELRGLLARNETIPLDGLTDIRPQLHKSLIQGAYLTPPELITVMEAIRSSRLLRAYFKQQENTPNLTDFCSILHESRFLEKHINDAIDETGMVRDSASRELANIRREIQETSAKLRARLRKILQKVVEEDLAMEDYVTQREGRYVLPIKVEHKRQIPGVIHSVSQTGSTVFLEPSEIFESNNQLSMLYNEEQREIIRILSTLTGELGAEAREFLSSIDILANFDAIYSKAQYALKRQGIKPQILDENRIELRNVYHPLLQWSSGSRPVPLSIEFTSDTRGHLISGPNAGGKTVALKSIGLNIAMALSGIFPLGDCETNVRSIFCAIGDHQSIENNLSTFSSQIVRLRDILSFCSPQALILVDEICSGTDPQEGGALAAGILDSFIERKAMFVVTTHQSSLKSYALSRPEILNASMEFDGVRLIPTYRFQSGVPGNSYAFALAKSVGIPDVVMSRAKTYLGDRHSELEESIAALQRFKQEAEEHLRKAAQEHIISEKKRIDYEERLAEVKAKRNQIIGDARDEAKDIVQRSNALVEQTIKEIREQQRSASDIKKDFETGKKDIEKKAEAMKPKLETDNEVLQAGDGVTMVGSNEVGVVIAIDTAAHSAVVEFNGLKFKTALAQLRKAGKTKQKEASKSSGGLVKFDSKMNLDLRGQRADAACKEVEQFISDAMLSNLQTLTIIHGKGTGALRVAIHDQLRKHPLVANFRLGTIQEGGDGVTILELK